MLPVADAAAAALVRVFSHLAIESNESYTTPQDEQMGKLAPLKVAGLRTPSRNFSFISWFLHSVSVTTLRRPPFHDFS